MQELEITWQRVASVWWLIAWRAFLGATRCAPFRGSCRSGRLYPFRIFYRVRGDVIHIVHIRHTSRRPVAGLNEPGRQYA